MTNSQPCPFCTLPPERILHRNSREGIEIHSHLNQLGFNGTADTSKHIAHWAYQHALQQNALLWVGIKDKPVPIQNQVMRCF